MPCLNLTNSKLVLPQLKTPPRKHAKNVHQTGRLQFKYNKVLCNFLLQLPVAKTHKDGTPPLLDVNPSKNPMTHPRTRRDAYR
jgi:hypothetical protein